MTKIKEMCLHIGFEIIYPIKSYCLHQLTALLPSGGGLILIMLPRVFNLLKRLNADNIPIDHNGTLSMEGVIIRLIPLL